MDGIVACCRKFDSSESRKVDSASLVDRPISQRPDSGCRVARMVGVVRAENKKNRSDILKCRSVRVRLPRGG